MQKCKRVRAHGWEQKTRMRDVTYGWSHATRPLSEPSGMIQRREPSGHAGWVSGRYLHVSDTRGVK